MGSPFLLRLTLGVICIASENALFSFLQLQPDLFGPGSLVPHCPPSGRVLWGEGLLGWTPRLPNQLTPLHSLPGLGQKLPLLERPFHKLALL